MKISAFGRNALSAVAGALFLASCGGGQTPIAAPGAMTPSGVRGGSQHHDTNGNIYWSRQRLDLPYPTRPPQKAKLTYWGPDGYYSEAHYCKNGGQFSATPHRQYGNPSGYVHLVFWFKALTSGHDDCAYTVVLNNTGSPPIAIIRLHIQ